MERPMCWIFLGCLRVSGVASNQEIVVNPMIKVKIRKPAQERSSVPRVM